jgi:hypothetical protein
MAGRTRSHSEARWAQLHPTVIRCNGTRPNGDRCKREAEDGSVVCDQHGGAAPQDSPPRGIARSKIAWSPRGVAVAASASRLGHGLIFSAVLRQPLPADHLDAGLPGEGRTGVF